VYRRLDFRKSGNAMKLREFDSPAGYLTGLGWSEQAERTRIVEAAK